MNAIVVIAIAVVSFAIIQARNRIISKEFRALVHNSVVQVKSTTKSSWTYSSGSGFAYDNDRGIVTAAHVVVFDNSASLEVIRADGKRVPAELLAIDRTSDIALLRTSEPHNLNPLSLAASTIVDCEGVQVVAIAHRGMADAKGAFKIKASRVLADEYAVDQLSPRKRRLAWALDLFMKHDKPSSDDDSIRECDVVLAEIGLRDGMSGGPLLRRHDRKVLGVNSFSYNPVYNLSGFTPAENVRSLIENNHAIQTGGTSHSSSRTTDP